MGAARAPLRQGGKMFKRIKSIFFVVCVVMVFTAQTYRLDDKGQQRSPAARPAFAAGPIAVVHNNQSRPQVQNPRQAPKQEVVRQEVVRKEASRQIARRAIPAEPAHQFQASHQERQAPRVYAVAVAPVPVENNRLFHRQRKNHWQPRYNFYDNQYHFYPYVNIASTVDLAGGYTDVGPDGQNYYYDQGTFYLQNQVGQYVAVPPPVGIIVNPIVANARQINVNNQIFYRYKGVFYLQVAQGYQVIGPVQSGSDDS